MSALVRSRARRRNVQPWKQPTALSTTLAMAGAVNALLQAMEPARHILEQAHRSMGRYGRALWLADLERTHGDLDLAARRHVEGHEVAA